MTTPTQRSTSPRASGQRRTSTRSTTRSSASRAGTKTSSRSRSSASRSTSKTSRSAGSSPRGSSSARPARSASTAKSVGNPISQQWEAWRNRMFGQDHAQASRSDSGSGILPKGSQPTFWVMFALLCLVGVPYFPITEDAGYLVGTLAAALGTLVATWVIHAFRVGGSH